MLLGCLVVGEVWAQQLGTSVAALEGWRVGMEAGGYLNRNAGTGGQVRMGFGSGDTLLDAAIGNATGERGARAQLGVRQTLVKEEMNFPKLALRAFAESARDAELVRRNAVGAGPILSQGFALEGVEFDGFAHPRAMLAIENTSNEFVFASALGLGLNSQMKHEGRRYVASVELELGFQNTPNALMIGVATDL